MHITRLLLICLLTSLCLTACNYTQKIRDGRTAVAQKQYSLATELLEKEYRKTKSRVEKGKLAYLIGQSYDAMHRPSKAVDWYQIAYDNQYGVEALRDYAYALKQSERYEEAKDAFKELGLEIGSPYEYRRDVQACEFAIGWQKGQQQAEYEIEILPLSSSKADYAAIPYGNDQLVFTSDRAASTGDDPYLWTGNDFSDLYIAAADGSDASPLGSSINTEDNEGTATFSADGQVMIFTRCAGAKKADKYCQLYLSEKTGDQWGPARLLPFQQSGVNYMHPSLSQDGKQLYYSSNDDEGWGGYDIYRIERTADSWGEPELLGRSINTIGNEQFPHIDADTLYFSSDYHPGMGGLDVFRTYKYRANTWAPVQNLKPPINSGSDDFAFVPDRRQPTSGEVLAQGYFSTSRENGDGMDDIYRYQKVKLPPPPPDTSTTPVVYRLILDGYVLEKIYREPDNPNTAVLGRRPLPAATVQISIGNQRQSVTVDEAGYFTLELEPETDYDFLAAKPGYLNNGTNFSTRGIAQIPEQPVQRFEVEIVLDKIYTDREITLENIYYDFDKWDIRPDAEPALNKLARNLQLNPDIRVQLSSHTDCRGQDRYNETLSQRRAQSAVSYLISKGIDASRLEAKGYGEAVPETDCACNRCSEEEHQRNRRTTFKVLGE